MISHSKSISVTHLFFIIPMILFSTTVHTSVSEAAKKSRILRITENCVIAMGLLGSIGGRIEADQAALLRGDLHFETNVAREISRHFFGPLTVLFNLLERRRNLSREDALIQTFRYDYGYLIGYASIYLMLKKTKAALFDIRFDDFIEESNRALRTLPGNVLLLSSIAPGDPLAGFPDFFFKNYYGETIRNAETKSILNLQHLIETLEALERKIESGTLTPFDRIEFFIHGNPNSIEFADGSRIGGAQLKEALSGRTFSISNEKGEMRFISCSLAASKPFREDTVDFMSELGNAVLTKGGIVIGSPRNLAVADELTGFVNVAHHAVGMGNFRYLTYGILPSAWRNYRESLKQVIVKHIPAQQLDS